VAESFVVDVALDVRLHDVARVTVHHGTRETPARVAWLGGRFHQLRCERALAARPGDRLVVRSIAPPDTLGGGVVLEAPARKHGPSREVTARLERLERGEPATVGRRNPPDSPVSPTKELGEAELALEERLRAGPAAFGEVNGASLAALREHGRAERVGPFAVHADEVARVRGVVEELIGAEGSVTLARLRDALGTSRKHAQAFLEFLDAQRVTRRLADDSRVLSGGRAAR
jgi:selenocysteine-specific elongation factor